MKVSDELIISALMNGRTNKEAAEQCGLSETQLYERMRAASFKEKYQNAQELLLQRASDKITLQMTAALDTIAEIMINVENPPTVRLTAATTILKDCTMIRELSRQVKKWQNSDEFDLDFSRTFYGDRRKCTP